jgi:chorismate dehydratase
LTGIQLGAPDYVSVRPLLYGLTRRTPPRVELVFRPPGMLSEALANGNLDAALVPSIEYLRGIGSSYVDGPALVARPAMGGTILVTKKPIDEVERIAVGEFARSPIALLRVVLAEKYGITPDLCVAKSDPDNWTEVYDGILLNGNDTLRYLSGARTPDTESHNVVSMWDALTSTPFVMGLWVYNDESIAAQLSKLLVASRNLGMQNLSRLADGIAQTIEFDGSLLYGYLSSCWDFQLTEAAKTGLRTFEELALRYDLIRCARTAVATTE